MKNKAFYAAGVLLIAAFVTVFSGCGKVNVEVTSPTSTVNLPTTLGTYNEASVPVPKDAQRTGVTLEEITIYYTAENTGTEATTAEMYVKTSPSDPAPTMIAQMDVPPGGTVTGSSSDPALKELCKATTFTVGFRRTGTAAANLKLTCYVKVKISIDFVAYYTGQ